MRLRLPGPALTIAVLALFISLSGTAVAAGIVPLAKRALSADNAKKLGGQTAAQISAQPGPASSVAGLATVRNAPVNVGPEAMAPATVACAAGEKASGGGFAMGSGAPLLVSSAPTADGSGWTVVVVNLADGAGSGTAYAVCVK